jgi:hypothetical protein
MWNQSFATPLISYISSFLSKIPWFTVSKALNFVRFEGPKIFTYHWLSITTTQLPLALHNNKNNKRARGIGQDH